MAVIQKQSGSIVAVSMVMLILGDFIKFMNVGKSMNELQLSETAKLIVQEFYFLKPEDLKIFFTRFKSGQYGQLFDRLDGQVIMFKLREYCEERILIAENLALESHKEVTAAEQQETYYVKINDNYIRESADEYHEEERIELATKFSFIDAIALKKSLSKSSAKNKFSITYSAKSQIGFIDFLKEKKPELAKEIEGLDKPKELVRTHAIRMAQIEAEDLLPLDKENKKRGLAGLAPITQPEYDLRNEMYK